MEKLIYNLPRGWYQLPHDNPNLYFLRQRSYSLKDINFVNLIICLSIFQPRCFLLIYFSIGYNISGRLGSGFLFGSIGYGL